MVFASPSVLACLFTAGSGREHSLQQHALEQKEKACNGLTVSSKVVRGPDWEYGEQEGGGVGVIVEDVGGGWMTVKWNGDHSVAYAYRVGLDGKCDLKRAPVAGGKEEENPCEKHSPGLSDRLPSRKSKKEKSCKDDGCDWIPAFWTSKGGAKCVQKVPTKKEVVKAKDIEETDEEESEDEMDIIENRKTS